MMGSSVTSACDGPDGLRVDPQGQWHMGRGGQGVLTDVPGSRDIGEDLDGGRVASSYSVRIFLKSKSY